jgi:RNA 3'-terminal phosphate cyclase
MQQNQTLSQRVQQYRASKAVLLWACAGSVVVATIFGFSWGGWVTGGSAEKMAEDSAAQARQEVSAIVCVDRFMAAPDAGVQLTALKEISSSYAQGKFVEEGGWAIILPASSTTDFKVRADDRKAAKLCAEELAKQEIAAPSEAALMIGDEASMAQ